FRGNRLVENEFFQIRYFSSRYFVVIAFSKLHFLSLGHHGIDSLTLSESGHLVFIKFQ
ncbi:hypothetical protein BDN67DRAFT_971383, partial [Paxillus ammoniavirescens]